MAGSPLGAIEEEGAEAVDRQAVVGAAQTVTAHGFRSTFSDWAHEQNGVMPLVIEESLAHRVGGATHLSYRRGHLLAQRRALMDAWAAYCMGRGGRLNVARQHRHSHPTSIVRTASSTNRVAIGIMIIFQ